MINENFGFVIVVFNNYLAGKRINGWQLSRLKLMIIISLRN